MKLLIYGAILLQFIQIMISKIPKNIFFDLLKLWQTNLWYYDENVINAAEKIAESKGFEISYFKIVENGNVIGLFPIKFKKRHCFFKYGEYLISKDLGIDNIELLIDWSKTDVRIFKSLEAIFTKIELHHLKSNVAYINTHYQVSSRKILFLDCKNHNSNYSKNFSQNIRTAKNRISKTGTFNFVFQESNQVNFFKKFNLFANNHFSNKNNSSWNDVFFRLLFDNKIGSETNLNYKFLTCELQINDETVAGIFGWEQDGVFYFNQSFYIKEYAQFSPVVLIVDYFCENALKNYSITCFDFMRGTEKYKSNFAKEFYHIYNLEIRSSVYKKLLQIKKKLFSNNIL